MRPDAIDLIANRAAHATPGPWNYYYSENCYREERTDTGWIQVGRNGDTLVPAEDWLDGLAGRISLRGAESERYGRTSPAPVVYELEFDSSNDDQNIANAMFISNSRADIITLLDYITDLEKQLEENHDATS